ncbi:pyridoxamine 5'-phosphate oxidase family protein [Streptomyces sp. NPDC088925]|uniref:pyridoxamine 5'-phosphate oxidase family protein n=1 Tax=Streptomyces sp. NPDC088925 TaxID=3365914 RepID=UPI00380729E3
MCGKGQECWDESVNAQQDTPGTHPAADPADGLPQQSTEAVPRPGPPRPGAPLAGPPEPDPTLPGAPLPGAPASAVSEPRPPQPQASQPFGAPHTSPAPHASPAPDSEAATRLARERNVWLCTSRANGTPHVTPVWFVHHLGRWWIGSDERAVKIRNIRRSPTVSLALEDGDHPLVAEGTICVLTTPFPPEIVAAFREKYGWDVSASRPGAGARVLLEVRTVRWLLAGTAR